MSVRDRIDDHILVELQKDGRLSNVELAKRVGLSATPCLERVKRLEKQGTIKGYTANLNFEHVHRGLIVFIEVKLTHNGAEAFKKFRDAVKMADDVLECHFVSGEFDFILKVRVADMASYRTLFDKTILAFPHIQSTKTIVVMEEIKSDRDTVIYL